MASGKDQLVENASPKEVGGKKSTRKKYDKFFLSYPLDRLNVGEDSFLIQSVRYKPPEKRMGTNLASKMNEAYLESDPNGKVIVDGTKGVIKYNDYRSFFLIMILGGSMGNLFDRVYFKAVPDFIDVHYNDFHWFVFNVADIFITIGVLCLILSELFVNKDLKNEKK